MLSPDILIGPRLKVERAYRHIDELRSLTEPLSRDFYIISCDKRSIFPDSQKPGIYVHYKPLKPIPEILAVVIGDAIHNLRSALDHVATGICRTVKPSAKEHFPIHPKRKNLESAPVLDLIERAIPGAKKAFLNEIRPENGLHETLWRFNDLNNDDKHNLLIPAVTISNVTGVDVYWAGNSATGNLFSNDAASPHGIAGFPGGTNKTVTVKNNPTVAVDVSFGQGTPFEGEPVIPTLVQISNLVTETLNAFEVLIKG
jgi:hypothetical protein